VFRPDEGAAGAQAGTERMPASIRDAEPEARRMLLKVAWAVARIAISVAVLYGVFSRIPFRDRDRVALEGPGLAPPRIEGELVREDAAAVTVRTADGLERSVPRDRVARRETLPPRPGLASLFRTASRPGLVFFLALSVVPYLLISARWWRLVRDQGVPLAYGASLRLTLIGTFFNNFLLGSTGGDVVKAALAGAETGRTARLLSTVVLDRLVGLIVIVLIAALGILAFLPFAPPAVQAQMAVPGLVVGGLLAGFLGLYLVYYSRALRGSAPARWLQDRLPFREQIREMDEVFLVYRAKPALIAFTAGLSLVSQAVLIASMFVAGRAIGIREASFLHYVVLIPIIELALCLPISFAGWGVGEAVYGALFGLAGVAPVSAVALSLLNKLTVILIGLPGGLAFAFGRRKEPGPVAARGAVPGRGGPGDGAGNPPGPVS